MRWTAMLLATLALAACKAKPAKPAGFVDSARMKKLEDLPFHRAWRNPKLSFFDYDRIYVAPVDTSHLFEMNWWKRGEAGSKKKFKQDVKKIAVDTRKAFADMFRHPPKGVKNRFKVVDHARGPKTLVLEVAIVEIVPSKVALEALSWVMPLGTGVLLTPLNTSTAAIEGRFKDARTGEVLLAFADREGEKARPVDLAGFTWYAHAKGILKDWARQLVQVANQKPGEKIPDTKTFTLKPW